MFDFLLHSKYVDVNSRDAMGNTVLISAIAKNGDELATLLTHPGIDIHAQNSEGETALMVASKYGRMEALTSLLQREDIITSINSRDAKGATALIQAAEGKQAAAVQALISMTDALDVNATDNQGFTALMWACKMNSKPVVEALLAAPSVDVTVKAVDSSRVSWTALSLAMAAKPIDMQLLKIVKSKK